MEKKMKLLFSVLVFLIVVKMACFSNDFWERVNVPNDTPVNDLMFDTNGDLYSCCFGIFKTTDLGNSWIEADEANIQGQTIKLTRLNNPLSCLAVTKNGSIIAALSDGILFRSKDKGETWDVLTEDIQNIHGFLVTENGRIFANQAYDLYYSDDDGDTWTRFNGFPDNNLGDFSKVRMSELYPGKLLVSYKGVWIIDEKTLESQHFITDKDSSWVHCFAVGNGKVLAATDTNGIFISSDSCKNWTHLANSPAKVPITAMLITPTGKIIAGSQEGGLFISNDNGNTWAKSDADFSSMMINDIELHNGEIYIASFGIFKSNDDGITWQPLPNNPGYPLVGFYDMEKSGKKAGRRFAYTYYSLYYSDDGGYSWNRNIIKDFNVLLLSEILLADDGKLFAWSNLDELFLYSDDSGKTWKPVLGPFAGSDLYSLGKNSLGYLYLFTEKLFSPNNLYVSKDNGNTWEIINNSPVSIFFGFGSKNEIISEDNDTIHFSTDYGSTWEHHYCPLISSMNGYVHLFEMHGDYIWLGTSQNGVIMSSDKGNTWAFKNVGMVPDIKDWGSSIYINDIKFVGGTLYAGVDFGLFASDDFGRNWVYRDSGMVRSYIEMINTFSDNHIYAITSTGVYRSVDQIVSVGEEPVKTNSYVNNYPNPFNKLTVINYKLSKSDNVILKIYDEAGKEISTLVNEYQNIGSHEAIFNADGLPQGNYYYKLQIGNKAEGSKLILVR
jgi:photosystem II stability/assembly factor-like uncharacterized protein